MGRYAFEKGVLAWRLRASLEAKPKPVDSSYQWLKNRGHVMGTSIG
jgi:hypothetical protein